MCISHLSDFTFNPTVSLYTHNQMKTLSQDPKKKKDNEKEGSGDESEVKEDENDGEKQKEDGGDKRKENSSLVDKFLDKKEKKAMKQSTISFKKNK